METITANELRIGNWVNIKTDFENIGQVTAINTMGVKIRNLHNFYSDANVEGIPLTPEILEKAGFVQIYKDQVIEKYANPSVNKFGIYIENKKFYLFKYNQFGIDTLCEVKYLHTFQNQIFSLTNSELTINI